MLVLCVCVVLIDSCHWIVCWWLKLAVKLMSLLCHEVGSSRKKKVSKYKTLSNNKLTKALHVPKHVEWFGISMRLDSIGVRVLNSLREVDDTLPRKKICTNKYCVPLFTRICYIPGGDRHIFVNNNLWHILVGDLFPDTTLVVSCCFMKRSQRQQTMLNGNLRVDHCILVPSYSFHPNPFTLGFGLIPKPRHHHQQQQKQQQQQQQKKTTTTTTTTTTTRRTRARTRTRTRTTAATITLSKADWRNPICFKHLSLEIGKVLDESLLVMQPISILQARWVDPRVDLVDSVEDD